MVCSRGGVVIPLQIHALKLSIFTTGVITFQLNVYRGTMKRKGTYMDRLDMPFRHDQFNFTKVKSEEILFELAPKHSTQNVTTILRI